MRGTLVFGLLVAIVAAAPAGVHLSVFVGSIEVD